MQLSCLQVESLLDCSEIILPSISDFPAGQATKSINNCPPPSRIFHGQQAILDKMHQFFTPDLGKQHIYVLYGLGGAGKTQIALKFSEQSSHILMDSDLSSFTDKILLDASTTETIDTGLKNIATKKNTGSSSQDALRWLATHHEEWLLLFDNADDPKINLNNFLPPCSHGNILITSRNPVLCVYSGSHSHVTDMEETDAVALLLKSATQEMSVLIASLIYLFHSMHSKTLCYLPLAIIQAGAFISESGALDSHLDLYTKNQAQLLSEKGSQTHDDYAWTVYTTWQMSFDKLSRLAAIFLQLCSFLHRDGISEDIFSKAATYRFPSQGPSRQELQKPLEFLSQFLGPNGEWDSLHFLKVTNEIRAYSLINFDPERKVFSIHPLVHIWSQTTLSDPQSYHSCMCAIVGMSTRILGRDIQLISLRLISHLNSLMSVSKQPTADWSPQYGAIYYYAGRYEEAKELSVLVLKRWRKLHGDDHPDTLWAMHCLAMIYQQLGKYKQAAELGIVVLEKRRNLLGDNHPYTLHTMGNLAHTYNFLAQSEKAEELGVVALEKWRQLLGDDDLDTLRAMNLLAITYINLGQLPKAEELGVSILQKQRKLLGDDHPYTLSAMHNLGRTYHCMGHFLKAEELQVVVLEKRRKL
ncbi:hypothetical protein B0H19DRAFT_994749, partial [Mycena capillaripes]